MTEAVRVSCCVPFCRRWKHGVLGEQMICWDHWKRLPLARRKAFDRAVAENMAHWLRRRRFPRWMQPRARRVVHSPRPADAIYRLWDRARRDAIARAL